MFPQRLFERETAQISGCSFHRHAHFPSSCLSRLGFEGELTGHQGCVNCIQWNRGGSVIMSGSDDLKVNIWDPFTKKLKQRTNTKHTGNIFSVKFMPFSSDNIIATGAADQKIHILDLSREETIQSYKHHWGRVKRLEVSDNDPHIVWSAAEDGLVLQMDLRCDSDSAEVLVNLNGAIPRKAEAKCVAVNPVASHLIAVGANDPYMRLYDRRMIRSFRFPDQDQNATRKQQFGALDHINLVSDITEAVQYFVPGHLRERKLAFHRLPHSLASTYVAFSPSGDELLVNVGGEHIYLFHINEKRISLLHESRKLQDMCQISPTKKSSEMSPEILSLKTEANDAFTGGNLHRAIELYNEAFSKCENPILICNRGAAEMKRDWNGDTYACLRDCFTALEYDPKYIKAHLRAIQCLFQLGCLDECERYLSEFRVTFPEHANGETCTTLEADIEKERKKKENGKGDNGKADIRKPDLSPQEELCRSRAYDYEKRFTGHCNTTTDIKEANFLGSAGEYIAAGSDDGHIFIWEKKTMNIVRMFHADESIVNCVQMHPDVCLIASSGIDTVVRLWAPQAQKNPCERVVNMDTRDQVTGANQSRMNTDPFEAFFMNMTYDLVNRGDNDDEDDDSSANIQCNPS